SYFKFLITKENGTELNPSDDLSESIKFLFKEFFSDKVYQGPQSSKTSILEFPIQTKNGSTHSFNELSSGEKELLFGYVRIRSNAHKNSIILIDEPELHLNPGLIKGLAVFYDRYLGRELNNQLWLVTHSDTLIRDAIGKQGFNVFHLQPVSSCESDNQIS